MVLRNCLGMIMSVSMFCRSIGAALPLRVVNTGMPCAPAPGPALPLTGAGAMTKSSLRKLLESVVGTSSPVRPAPEPTLRTSVSLPLMAAAAAIAGDTRCVRPPLPWRPSKLRLEVEAQRSWGSSLSGFIARHMEHPGSRQSNPAALSTTSRPSASACSFTMPEPGTTMAYTVDATFLPRATAATARMSSMRPLVQEPMNTLSTGTSSILVPGVRPMYVSERSMAAMRCGSAAKSAGLGTTPEMDTTSCGEVPHVTVGSTSDPLMITSLSYAASSSEASDRQYVTALSQAAPRGAMGRPLR
mmetsp:Transcript_32545/g.80235  ORF Transcript_32545/g.80235 Transcript_32545/m.80235 type:complete len:301 (+) Transcript_32545:808-1710(+)